MPARYPDRELPASTSRDARRARGGGSIQPLTPPPAFGSHHYGGATPAQHRRGGAAEPRDGRSAGPPLQGSSQRNTSIPPRYVPGAAPSYGPAQSPTGGLQRPRRGDGHYPAAGAIQPPAGGKARRTDPTLYEWDRLSLEQQQAVMAAIGSAGQTRRGIPQRVIMGGLLVTAFLAIVVMLAILLH
jgi:hypothetical protein